jgi:transposase-like protein
MANETARRYLFVAIDRATRWVFIRVYNSKTAANARRFLRDLERTCPLSGHCVAMPCRAVNADPHHSYGASQVRHRSEDDGERKGIYRQTFWPA